MSRALAIDTWLFVYKATSHSRLWVTWVGALGTVSRRELPGNVSEHKCAKSIPFALLNLNLKFI